VNATVLLAADLVRRGVTTVFGLMGEDTARLTLSLVDHGIRYHSARHESTAVAMADGFARATGEVGVAVVSRGPGLTNALTAMVTAGKGGSRVLVIVGTGSATEDLGGAAHPKKIDQEKVLDGAGIGWIRATSAVALTREFDSAWARARDRVLTVFLLPVDVGVAQLPDVSPEAPEAGVGPQAATIPLAAEPDAVAEFVDLLESTETSGRVVILAGRGAVDSGAGPALAALGRRTGAILATTLHAKGLFAGEAFDMGICGTYATQPAISLLARADLVLCFGASLDPFTVLDRRLFPRAVIARVDSATQPPHDGPAVVLRATADADLFARALGSALAARGHQRVGFRNADTQELLAAYDPRSSFRDVSEPDRLDPRTLMIELDRILPKDRAVVVDNGHHWTFSTAFLGCAPDRAFHVPNDYFCVGAARGVALGAAAGRPDRTTVLCIGDGGALMSQSDLDTAVRCGLPLGTVVVNDAAYGSEVHFLGVKGLPDELARHSVPDFAAMAQAAGMETWSVRTLADLPSADALDAHRRPWLLDCHVTTAVRADWVDMVFANGE
jgi:acetolactate synthase I/II/III large subunit